MTRIRSRYRRIFYGHGIADPASAPAVSPDRVTHVHPRDLDEFLRRYGRQATLTFDDGYADNLTTALPILEKYAQPATVFVTTGFIDRSHALLARVAAAVARDGDWHKPSVAGWIEPHASDAQHVYRRLRERLKTMSVAQRYDHQQHIMADYGQDTATLTADYLTHGQLAELDAHPLITIGAHTVSHPDLRFAGDDELKHELVAARSRLEQWLGHRVTTIAYPFGDTDARVRDATAAAGYKHAYLTDTPNWRCRVPVYRRLDRPRADLAWEVFRMREGDRKQTERNARTAG